MGVAFLAVFFIAHIPLEVQSDPKSGLPFGQYASFQPEGDIRRFVGETLYFDISFLWFKNAATAYVGFYEKNGEYYSYLDAQTKGFVGFFTAYRRHIYQTSFEIIDGGKRVRPKRFMREVIEGGSVERADHFFDYQTREHRWRQTQDEITEDSGTEDIPPGTNFDDVLTAFYNFRNSVYGPIRKNEKYVIKTIPEKGHDEITIHVREIEEVNKVRKEEGREPGEDLLVDIVVPKSIFKTESGIIRLWASKHYIPIESTIKDYIFLGDLHAKFKERTERHSKVTGNIPVPSLSPASR
ncbi:MAG: hypothetical protein NPINA01_32520 [Nitrospinaceae bacterium]|nr:MAG: hypothetical protein NPINA01_32520 [Nitrospinaceae bacterium]